MSKKSLKVQLKVCDLNLTDSVALLGEIKENVFMQLKQQNITVTEAILIKSCKNALSLARSRKNNSSKILNVYIPQTSINTNSSCNSNSISSVNIDSDNKGEDESLSFQNDDTDQGAQLKIDFFDERGVVVETNFFYLHDIFSSILSRSSVATKLDNLVNEISAYFFNSENKYYVNLSAARRELSRQLSHFVRNAKKKAKTKHTTAIKVLNETASFVFYLKSVESVQKSNELSFNNFELYTSVHSSDHILLAREKDQVCIQSGKSCLNVCISQSFALRALEQFELINIIDVDELLYIIESYCRQRHLMLDIENTKDSLKTSILDRREHIRRLNCLSCTIELSSQKQQSSDEDIDLDSLLGSVYSTRGIKRKLQEVPIHSDDSDDSDQEELDIKEDDLWELNPRSSCKSIKEKSNLVSEKEELLRKFLHIKDEYHITDSAIKAMHKFFRETKQSFYSKAEIERIQRKANRNIPLKYTKDSAYVPFEFALRAAILLL